jgi:hypothetical protein
VNTDIAHHQAIAAATSAACRQRIARIPFPCVPVTPP